MRTLLPDDMLESGGGGTVIAAAGNVGVYSTQALAVAASPGADILGIITLGFHSDPTIQGGVAYWRYLEVEQNPVTDYEMTCANGRRYELSVDVADVKIFGAKGNGTGDDAPAIQAAINYAKQRLPYQVMVWVPAGIFHVSTQLTFDYNMIFLGSGRASELRGVNLTTSMFRCNLASAPGNGVAFGEIGNFHASLAITNGSPQVANCFSIEGPANSYFQWFYIHDIISSGWNAFWSSSAGAHVTAFGNEGPCNWNTFHNITFAGSSAGFHLIGFVFNTGSGTGNAFFNCHGFIHNYAWLYQGGAFVVGDIQINGGHFGSYNTTSSMIFAVAPGAQYRSRVRIKDLQGDAGMSKVLQLAGTWDNVIVDVTRGGACAMGNYGGLTNSNLGPTLTSYPAA